VQAALGYSCAMCRAQHRAEVHDDSSRAVLSPVCCQKTGCADIIIGREDGSLEVWDVDGLGSPQLVVSTQLPESITAVSGGYITNPASPDIVVHTFTGKVCTSTHPLSSLRCPMTGLLWRWQYACHRHHCPRSRRWTEFALMMVLQGSAAR